MRKLIVTAVVAGAVVLGTPAVASARPVLDPVVTPEDVGPDKTDWWCTSSWSMAEQKVVDTCVYEKGVNAYHPLQPGLGHNPKAKHWWNPWSWGWK